jgi:hypothetical protein
MLSAAKVAGIAALLRVLAVAFPLFRNDWPSAHQRGLFGHQHPTKKVDRYPPGLSDLET